MCAKVAAAQPATAEQSGGAPRWCFRTVEKFEFAWMANEVASADGGWSLPDVLTYHVPGQQLQTH